MLTRAALTDRDIDIVYDIYSYRYMTTSQIMTLHFTSRRSANRRLQRLADDGFIDCFKITSTHDYVFYATQGGKRLLSFVLDAPVNELKTNGRESDSLFFRHHLKINDFRAALTAACRCSDLQLAGFIPEYLSDPSEWALFESGQKQSPHTRPVKYIKDSAPDLLKSGKTVSHIPDAVFALSKNNQSALFFLEIDRGTETIGNVSRGLLKCIYFYLNYLAHDGYQRYREDFCLDSNIKGFRTLIATTSMTRILNVRNSVAKISFDDRPKQFILLTDFSKISVEKIFKPVWLSADILDSNLYNMLGSKYELFSDAEAAD